MIKRIAAMLTFIPACGIIASMALIVPLVAGGTAVLWTLVGGLIGVVGVMIVERRRIIPIAIGTALALLLAAFGAGGGMLANAMRSGQAGTAPDPTIAAIFVIGLALFLAVRSQPIAPHSGAVVALGIAAVLTLILWTSGAAILSAALLFGALAGSIVLVGATAHLVAGEAPPS